MRRAALALSATLLSLACTDGFFFEPPESGEGWGLSLSLTTLPQFSTVGLQSAYDKSDQARITLHRLDGEQVMDTIVDFDPSNGEVAVDRPADIAEGGEEFDLVGELYSSSEMVFQGSTRVEIDATRGTPVELALAPIAVDIAAPESVLFDALGDTLHVPVTGFFTTGDEIDDIPVDWTVADPTIVVPTPEGDLLSLKPGTTMAFARSGEAEDTVELTVAPVVTSVEVDPDRVSLTPDQEAAFTAFALDRNGNALERDAVWSVDDERVATISRSGLLVALGEGTTTVRADVGGVVGTATVEVTTDEPIAASVTVEPNPLEVLLGYPATLRAIVRDASGSQLTDRAVAWSSSSSAIATVSADGVVTGVRTGSANITAIVEGPEGLAGSASVTVRAPAVSSVTLAPATLSILEGESAPLELTVLDERGGELTDRVATWSSSNPSVAQVSSAGVVEGILEGDAVITVTVEGRSATTAVSVSRRPIASVSIEPSTAEILLRDEVTFTAIVRDAEGIELTGREITWASSDGDIVSITGEGVATGVALGDATITATSEGVSGTATVTVSERPVASVTLTPESADIFVDGTVDFTATALDDAGEVLSGRVIAWTSSNEAAVTVSAMGVATGVAPGEAEITATVEGKSASATVTVSERPVASVEVTPTSAELVIGDEVSLTATARDAEGNILVGRTVVWGSGTASVASVDATGTVTGLSEGSATITATIGGVEASATISVIPVPVTTVEVTPPSAELFVGDEVTLTATARDADGNVLGGRTVAWSSSASGVASVNGSGLVTALSPGAATIKAVVEGVEATATIQVKPVPVASVEVSPTSANIFIGDDVALTATVRDADGNVLTGRAVGWSSNATGVATVNGSGLVTGQGEGTATITATVEGKTATATINVSPVPVASVTVSPSTAELIVGDEATFTATARDAGGNVLTGRTVTWASDAPSVASVSAGGGLVTALEVGTAKITATVEGIEGTATVTVVPVPVATVEVDPSTVELVEGDNTTLSAILRAEDGSVLTGRDVAWSSSNLSVATVSGTGLVTAVAPGSATITATSEGKSGTATVDVVPAPYPGEDIVVFNDVNIFETIDGFPLSVNNRTLVSNLVNYETAGARNSGTEVWFDFGRNSACGGECSPFNQRDTRSTIEDAGYSISDISSSSGSITAIPEQVKVVFLWLPRVAFTAEEINTFKQFAQDGGRIVFVGEHQGSYGLTGIAVENDFLEQMGATLTNSGGSVDCAGDTGRIDLPSTSLRGHQITEGMDGLQLSCASVIEPGPGDYPIIWDSSNTNALVGVARIDTTPLPMQ